MAVTPLIAAKTFPGVADAPAVRSTLGTAPATTSSTSSTPFGYSQAQADAILQLVIDIRQLLINVGIAK